MRKGATGDIKTTITERLGVSEIEKRCCIINWVFRERGHSDFGVDADMEESICVDGKYQLTNRHIAVQIKSGDSYAKKDKNGHYYFDIEDSKHANYWLGSDRPVVVMVYEKPNDTMGYQVDVDGLIGKVYWAQIRSANFKEVQNRKSKNDGSQSSKASHIYARVYLTNVFDGTCADVFSRMIDTYTPEHNSLIPEPRTEQCGNALISFAKRFERTGKELRSLQNALYSSLQSAAVITENDRVAGFEGIEDYQIRLISNKSVFHLLLGRYYSIMRKVEEIEELQFPEFVNFRDQGIRAIVQQLHDTISYLQEFVLEPVRKLPCITDYENVIKNQTMSIIEDYVALLSDHASMLASIVKTLSIKNKLGFEIQSVDDWEKAFKAVDKDETHWRIGYSAQSLAAFFSLPQGDINYGPEWLRSTIESLLNSGEVVFDNAEIEHPSKVDSLRGGQRMQDLALWGKAGTQSLFVGIEAKVLEEFDLLVPDAYQDAIDYRDKENERSMKYKRVEELVNRLFPGSKPTDDSVRRLRYQLFHYLVASHMEGATLSESRKPLKARTRFADITVLPVLVFKTPHYEENPEMAIENKRDFERFFDSLSNFDKINVPSLDLDSIYKGEMDGQQIYAFYKTLEITNPGQ